MFALLLSLVLSAEDLCNVCPSGNCPVNCMLCMERKGCVYVRKEKLCIAANNTEIEKYPESDRTTELDKECARDLGGDAIPSTRYAIGTCFLVVAIVVDLSVRFFSARQKTRRDTLEQQILQ